MMKFFRLLLVCLLLAPGQVWAQAKTALVKGRVLNEKQQPMADVNISLKDISGGTRTNISGDFSLSIPANRVVQITFSYVGYEKFQLFKKLDAGETVNLAISLKPKSKEQKDVIITTDKKRDVAGIVFLKPDNYFTLPTVNNSIEDLLKVFLSNNNELTSQYNVRGGNFDENLVYINDFEVYRPFLTRSGQQEGLSVINPDLVSGVTFSTGGFQAKYGDKMSSVLDIQYKRPKEFGGSVHASLLGVGAHLEGVGINRRLAYMVGVRQKSNQYLLQSQQTKGIYNPSFTDVQAFLNYQFDTQWQMDVFANYARNRFDFVPESSTQSFGVFNKAFQLRTFYNGKEIDKFDSRYVGLSVTRMNENRTKMIKFIASGFQTDESETYDIQGEYLLGEVETDLGKENFGDIKYSLGTGIIHNYARNYLKVNVGNIGHKGSIDYKNHFLQWGANAELVSITDKLNEWERRDSAGFTQPNLDTAITMLKRYKTAQDFSYQRLSAYVQDNVDLSTDSVKITLTYGLRANYNFLNEELLLSPRVQFAFQPRWKNDIIFRTATGVYSQPPFYREMRNLNGDVNQLVRAQKSYHAVAGFDYNFKGLGGRPFKFTTEFYFKYLWDLVPYEYDNVRIRYFGKNNARGYATGSEFRLYGDIVEGAESWLSLGIMKAMENLSDDKIVYTSKVNGADSATVYPGYIPRPTDSRVSFGMFFSDYLRKNKNFKAHIMGLYSTGLPFGPPDQQRYADTLRIPSYKRVDIGFSALLLDGSSKQRPRYSYFNQIKSVWTSIEIFNLLGIRNTLSYLWIQDFSSNRRYAVPNRLTARLLNVKVVVRF